MTVWQRRSRSRTWRAQTRGGARLAILLGAVVILTGCTSLAADPTIRAGLNVSRVQVDPELQVAPPGPRVGAEPVEIVRGFVQSLAGSSGDFVTSREFLTGPALDTWSPQARTLVFRGSVLVTDPRVTTGIDPDPDAAGLPDGAGATTSPAPGPTADPVPSTPSTPSTPTAPSTPSTVGPDESAGPRPTDAVPDAPADPGAEPTPAPTLPRLQHGETVLRLTARAWAEVSRLGHYREFPGTQTVSSDVVLSRVGGQWRIRHVDPEFGRWLATADFERLYDPYAVHYVSTGERTLIPDIRYVPTDRVATRLAQLQLGETPDYVLGAVRHDLPASAQLNGSAVPVLDGVATVDLRGQGIGSDPTSRENLWAQFFATLTQVRGVEQVQITLEGNPLEIPGTESVRSLSDLRFTLAATPARATALIRQGATIGQPNLRARLTGTRDEATPPPRNSQGFPWIDEEWQDLALSQSGGEMAGVAGDLLSRWRGRMRYESPKFATELGRPCYDRHDALWVGGIGTTVARERLFAINAAASPADPLRSDAQPVVVSWLTDRRVLGCHVSPQGTRIALITDEGTGTAPRLDVGAVIRTANGLPTAVVGRQAVGERFSVIADAVWLGETSMAVLGQTHEAAAAVRGGATGEGSELQPFLLTVGGLSVALPSIVGAERITSTGGERNIIVITTDDQVMVRVGPQWLPAHDSGSEVIVTGR